MKGTLSDEGAHDAKEQDEVRDLLAVCSRVGHRGEDLVLGKEAREREDPDQCQRADDEGPERDRHLLTQPAHVDHVVRMHGVDDGPCG